MRLLAGDIGGTKTILHLLEVSETDKSWQTLAEETYRSADFPDLVPMVQQFFAATGQAIPDVACLAIAGPVVHHTSKLTNLGWTLEEQRLEQELGIKQVSLINDFAGVSYGILGLKDSDLLTLQAIPADKDAPIAIVGAGTGLGESFLIPQGNNYQVLATEGGHSDFAPRSALEFELLTYLQTKFNLDHVSVERVVSGQGIVGIYQFLRDRNFAPENTDVGEPIRIWEQGNSGEQKIDPGAIIAQAALEKQDPLATKAMQMFVEAYGAEAGNFALKLLPYGGLYLAGGIAAKILPLMQDGTFLQAFKQKGRVSSLLEKVPVHIVLNPQVGLLGSVLYAIKD